MEKTLLLEDFYTIRDISVLSPEKMNVKVELNVHHPVYKGHFPQAPVAPGVCLIQMIKEVLMTQQNKKLTMTDGDNIKFMALVNPNDNPFFFIEYDLRFPSSEVLEISAFIRWEGITYLKFKGKYRIL
ncbi:MAG TPA: 3-hydroxyacyl-ACP dehydratase [Bacteroidia bacterium]|jgi:3-hydroxyacyl-[acyl-carrier-protein] dehydratase|nr:3-hydroxyacyl-ACP dehydratase [Bacteroidia bacterium]